MHTVNAAIYQKKKKKKRGPFPSIVLGLKQKSLPIKLKLSA